MSVAPDQIAKGAVDGASFFVTVGALADWLPSVAALFSIIWALLRIYESDSVQTILPNKLKLPKNRAEKIE